jgi:hypothetical protein
MTSHPMKPDARNLEEAFFARENAKLLERMREIDEREQRRDALRAVFKNADDGLLDHLADLGIGPETALAVMLIPLVSVAWADGDVADRERAAILEAAEEREIRAGTPAHALLDSWLGSKPGPELVGMWRRYVANVWSELTPAERDDLRRRLLGLARGVAEAAGGFLGLGSRISKAEQQVLDEIAAALP